MQAILEGRVVLCIKAKLQQNSIMHCIFILAGEYADMADGKRGLKSGDYQNTGRIAGTLLSKLNGFSAYLPECSLNASESEDFTIIRLQFPPDMVSVLGGAEKIMEELNAKISEIKSGQEHLFEWKRNSVPPNLGYKWSENNGTLTIEATFSKVEVSLAKAGSIFNMALSLFDDYKMKNTLRSGITNTNESVIISLEGPQLFIPWSTESLHLKILKELYNNLKLDDSQFKVNLSRQGGFGRLEILLPNSAHVTNPEG